MNEFVARLALSCIDRTKLMDEKKFINYQFSILEHISWSKNKKKIIIC